MLQYIYQVQKGFIFNKLKGGWLLGFRFTYKDYFTTVCKFLHLNLKIFYIKGRAHLNLHNFVEPT